MALNGAWNIDKYRPNRCVFTNVLRNIVDVVTVESSDFQNRRVTHRHDVESNNILHCQCSTFQKNLTTTMSGKVPNLKPREKILQ